MYSCSCAKPASIVLISMGRIDHCAQLVEHDHIGISDMATTSVYLSGVEGFDRQRVATRRKSSGTSFIASPSKTRPARAKVPPGRWYGPRCREDHGFGSEAQQHNWRPSGN